MHDATADRFAGELLPLLLPEPGGMLVCFGNAAGAYASELPGWEPVSSRNAVSGIEAAAVLAVGSDANIQRAWSFAQALGVPFTAIGRGRWTGPAASEMGLILREGHPMLGTPSFWAPASSDARGALPRSRRDRLRLALDEPFRPLRRLGIGRFCLADAKHSVIGRVMACGNPEEAVWQHTLAGNLMLLGRETVLKIPLRTDSPDYAEVLRLAEVRDTLPVEIRALVPTVEGEFEVAGHHVIQQDRLAGSSAFGSIFRRDTVERILEATTELLIEWKTGMVEWRRLDEPLLGALILDPVRPFLTALCRDGEATAADRLEAGLHERFCGCRLPLVPVHGDLWLHNILVDGASPRVTGIIDWDRARGQGLPLLDLFHVECWRSRPLAPDLSPSTYRRLLDPARRPARRVSRLASALDLPAQDIRPLVSLYVAGQLAEHAASDDALARFRRRRLLPVVEEGIRNPETA